MIGLTRENPASESRLTAVRVHSKVPRRDSETSPLTIGLESVKKSHEGLSRQCSNSSGSKPACGLLGALKKRLLRGDSNIGGEDIELAEVATQGKLLYQKAQAGRDAQSENQLQTLPFSLNSKAGRIIGAVTLLAGIGLCWRQFSQGEEPSATLPPDKAGAIPVSSAMTDTVGSSGSVNNHTYPYHRSINAHRHARANQPKPQTFTTTVTESGISKKRLFDFSCAKEREILSFSDVLRNIADTLSSPAKKMGEEWQIVYDYSLLKVGCPKASEKMFLLNILHYVDAVSETILHSFPEFIPLMILQNIAPPVLKTIADKLEGKKISFDVIIEVNKELLSVFQMLSASLDAHGINLLSKERDGRPGGIIPEKLKIEKGAVIVEVNGGEFKMNRDSYGVYVYELEQKSLALRKQYINYLRDKKIWVHQKKSVILSPVNPGDESVFEVSRKILNTSTNVAKNVGKDISSVNFITAVLARSGWVEGESLELMRGNSERLNLIINHIENKVSIKDTNQLLHLKSGQVVFFTQNKGSEVEAKYAMLAAGNGLFTGVHNEIFSGEFACEDITLTAEQLGGGAKVDRF